MDEYAYITQSYYSDLFFGGQFHHPAWLDYYAFDLQPLPKYLIGASLRLAHLTNAGPARTRCSGIEHYTPFGTPGDLDRSLASRSSFMGALGCVALFGCGVLVGDRRVGTIAALLLMINPLYRLHAHRAMSDVPCEAFLISALGLGLYALQRIWSGRSGIATLVLVHPRRSCRRAVDPLQVQRLPRADDHRLLGGVRTDCAAPAGLAKVGDRRRRASSMTAMALTMSSSR